jgi:type IV pilus assembly protein PilA
MNRFRTADGGYTMEKMIRTRKDQLQKRGVKGFTLMEMLIVVAIIAVLVAIAIPIFTAQLNKAKESADAANARSMYAVLAAAYMSGDTATTDNSTISANSTITITVTNDDSTTTTNSFEFSSVVTAGKVTAGGSDTSPSVSVTTNGTTYSYPTSTATA